MKFYGVVGSLFRFVTIQSVFMFVNKISTAYTLVTGSSDESPVTTRIASQNDVNSVLNDLGLSCSLAFNGSCCPENSFQCNDGSCIPFHKLCNSPSGEYNLMAGLNLHNVTLKADCSDGSDEFGCSYLPCSKRKFDCGFHCFELQGNKSFCSCHETLNASVPVIACSSVDQCSHELHTCSHDCLNLESSHECSCKEGFKIDNNGNKGSCKVVDRSVIILFYSDSHIYGYDLDKNSTFGLIHSGKVDSMDYDPTSDLIYWWNQQQHILERTRISISKDTNVTEEWPVEKLNFLNRSSSMTRRSISIDWSVGNLYWIYYTERKHIKSKILVSKMDGSAEETVFEVHGVKITSLVVDPLTRFIYWTNVGRDPGITVSCALGISVRSFVRLKEQYPDALTLDHGHGRLYWFDLKSNSIFARYKKGRKTVKVAVLSSDLVPESLDAFENHLYWVSKRSGRLIRLEKFGRGKPEILIDSLHKPSAVKVHHNLKYGLPSSKLIDKTSRIKSMDCTDVCVSPDHLHKCYQDLKKSNRVKDSNCKHLHNCIFTENKFALKHNSHSHKLRNELIVLVVALLILLVFGTCFVIFLFKRRARNINSKFIQLEEVN